MSKSSQKTHFYQNPSPKGQFTKLFCWKLYQMGTAAQTLNFQYPPTVGGGGSFTRICLLKIAWNIQNFTKRNHFCSLHHQGVGGWTLRIFFPENFIKCPDYNRKLIFANIPTASGSIHWKCLLFGGWNRTNFPHLKINLIFANTPAHQVGEINSRKNFLAGNCTKCPDLNRKSICSKISLGIIVNKYA